MSEPKLNRCLFCGSSDVEIEFSSIRPRQPVWVTCIECQADEPYKDLEQTKEQVAKAWNESYVAKAMETLADVLHDGGGLRQAMGFVQLRDINGNPIASGETMLDMVMDLQDKVGK